MLEENVLKYMKHTDRKRKLLFKEESKAQKTNYEIPNKSSIKCQ